MQDQAIKRRQFIIPSSVGILVGGIYSLTAASEACLTTGRLHFFGDTIFFALTQTSLALALLFGESLKKTSSLEGAYSLTAISGFMYFSGLGLLCGYFRANGNVSVRKLFVALTLYLIVNIVLVVLLFRYEVIRFLGMNIK